MNMINSTLDNKEVDNNLILNHLVLVKKIAHHLLTRLPNHVCVDDLVQAGMIGLIEASKNYNANKGASFSTYAGIRIRGSIIDEMRKGDWAPRSVHRNSRRVLKALHELEVLLGRDPSLSELATYLQIPIENLDKIMSDTQNTKIIFFEDLGISEDMMQSVILKEKTPDHIIENNQEKEYVASLVSKLPERERLVISLYYQEELNLKEIGSILEISESRVSQILSQAMQSLQQQWSLIYKGISVEEQQKKV
jgi:RNA polymerase sigma factor for flagellar operon FliA